MNPITRLATYHYQGNSLFLHRWRWFLSLVLLSLASPGYAQCVWKGANIGGDNYGASLQLGNVNITSNYIQPIDSILASSIISLVPARFWSDPEAVIYECDVADKDSLFEVFATNGDSNVGGYTNMGDNYFQTFFPYTALKLIHVDSGIEFTRIWQQVPLKKYDVVGNKIQIKGKHFSQIRAELKKVGTVDALPALPVGAARGLRQRVIPAVIPAINLMDMWCSKALGCQYQKQDMIQRPIIRHWEQAAIWRLV